MSTISVTIKEAAIFPALRVIAILMTSLVNISNVVFVLEFKDVKRLRTFTRQFTSKINLIVYGNRYGTLNTQDINNNNNNNNNSSSSINSIASIEENTANNTCNYQQSL